MNPEWELHTSNCRTGDKIIPEPTPKFIWADRTRYLFWKLMNEEWIIAKWYNSIRYVFPERYHMC